MKIEVSVIMPVYNSEKTCESAIRSVLVQDLSKLELIVIDDGSEDRTLDKCLRISKEDNRIKVIHQENKGVSAARNAGLNKATGEYVCFVDSDDSVVPHMFDILLKRAKQADADIVVCGYCAVEGDNIVSEWTPDKADTIEELCEMLLKSNMGLNTLWTKMFKRDLISQQFNTEKSMGEDLEFICNFLKNAKNCSVVPQKLYRYTVDSKGSLTKKKNLVLNAITEDFIIMEHLSNKNDHLRSILNDKIYEQTEGALAQFSQQSEFISAINVLFSNSEFDRIIREYRPNKMKNRILGCLLKYRMVKCIYFMLKMKEKMRAIAK